MHERDKELAVSDQEKEGGVFASAATLVAVVSTSIQDAIRLLGLEALFVFKTAVTILLLAVFLGILLAGIWFAFNLVFIASLFEHTQLGLMLSIACAAFVNLVGALILSANLKRLSQRLMFQNTRASVKAVFDDVSQLMKSEE